MVEMDARSPLSPKGTNSANELESGSVSKQSFIPAASVVYKRTSALVRSSPRTRRPATVDWLANFEAQDMKQLAAQVGQHDENLSVVGNVLRAAETSSRLDCENTRSDGGAVREPGRLEPGEEAADISSASTDPSAPVPLSDPENHNLSMEASSAMLEGKSLSEGEEKNTPEMVGAGRSFEAEAQEDAEEEEEDGNWEALPSEKVWQTFFTVQKRLLSAIMKLSVPPERQTLHASISPGLCPRRDCLHGLESNSYLNHQSYDQVQWGCVGGLLLCSELFLLIDYTRHERTVVEANEE